MANNPPGLVLTADLEAPADTFRITTPTFLRLQTCMKDANTILMNLSLEIDSATFSYMEFPEPSDPEMKKAIYLKLDPADFSNIDMDSTVSVAVSGPVGSTSYDLVFTVRVKSGKIGGGAGPEPEKSKKEEY